MILLVATVSLALFTSWVVVRSFSASMAAVLKRLIDDEVRWAWLKYLKFAIYVVGVSKGVRLLELERYIAPSRLDKDTRVLELNTERWVVEVYRTVIETLQGIAWVLLVFFLVALFAYALVRAFELRRKAKPDAPSDMKDD
jgi:hypothetical protein